MIEETNKNETDTETETVEAEIKKDEKSEITKETAGITAKEVIPDATDESAVETGSGTITEDDETSETTSTLKKSSPPAKGRKEYTPTRGMGDKRNIQRGPRYRRKFCRFCYNKNTKIYYRDAHVLEGFITERGKILPRRITGTCARHQRELTRAIKQARILSILPFVVK